MKIPKEILPGVTFAAGPAQGLESVRQTPLKGTLFERRHRNPLLANGLYKETEDNIRQLLGVPPEYIIIFFPGGATQAMDAVCWTLADADISGLNFGAFSNLWCSKICDCLPEGIKKSFVDFHYKNQDYSKLDLNTSLVLLTPNETSYGIALPDNMLKNIWDRRSKNTLIAWDATSCAGARDLPQDQYDIMLFAGQKAFGCAGGTCALILSPMALARAADIQSKRNIPFTLNLNHAIEKAFKHQTFNTPSTTNIWMINEACKFMLTHGGIKAMDKLCRLHAQTMLDFADSTDYLKPMISDENFRSYTTLTLNITDREVSDTQINDALRQTGLPNLLDGLEKYSTVKENSLRVACFPFTDTEGDYQFKLLCKTIDFIVKQLKNPS